MADAQRRRWAYLEPSAKHHTHNERNRLDLVCHGPGCGYTADSGRLVVPCDHIEATSKKYFSHVILSDDGGISWFLGGTTPQDQVNECEVVQLDNGNLLLNMRNYDRNQRARAVCHSDDEGLSWSDLCEKTN